MNERYTIGIDFGTLSARAVMVSADDGKEIASAEKSYTSAVICDKMPGSGEILPPTWALQDPYDYTDALIYTVNEVMKSSGVPRDAVVGLGMDFTSSTVLPVYADGTPLCKADRWKNERNAWVKLWKHHGGQRFADRINEIYNETGGDWLAHLGGKMSPESMPPKVWELYEEAPGAYADCDYIMEAGDWLDYLLTGNLTRSYQAAAYKAGYIEGRGYPSKEFLRLCDPGLEDFYGTKYCGTVVQTGSCIGTVRPEWAEILGLGKEVYVSAFTIDAHTCAMALGLSGPGDAFGIFGTSNCYFLLSSSGENVPGINGCVKDGVIPGLYGYEAGLCCVGDHFAWLADGFTPEKYAEEARTLGLSPLQLLIRKASELRPGQSGLVALDWWNGNRNILLNADLSGLIVGMTLRTKPEEILRALIEATAFGTRVIFDNYREHGIEIGSFIAAGGIPRKDPFTMQLFSDVLHMPIRVTATKQAGAHGAAIGAAAAAGIWPDLGTAEEKMKVPVLAEYTPDPGAGRIYDRLYDEYVRLHDMFGRGGNDVMMRLRRISEQSMKYGND